MSSRDEREIKADEIQSSEHTLVQPCSDISVSLDASVNRVYDTNEHFPIRELC